MQVENDIIKFFKKIFLFGVVFSLLTIPLSVILIGLPAYIFFFSGEATNLDKVVKKQIEENSLVLYGPAYSDQATLYKLKLIKARNCDVIALGSSRIMQLRDHFFRYPFCNAGGAIGNISQFKPFTQEILKDTRNKPKLLIISLDQYFFNPAWSTGSNTNGFGQYGSEVNYFSIFHENMSNIYSDYQKGKVNLKKIHSREPNFVGLSAVMKENGFRNDGSYLYGHIIKLQGVTNEMHEDYNFKDTFSRINNGVSRFEYGNKVSDYSIRELEQFLDYCSKNNIKVIGFMPPYASEVWEKIVENKEKYQYMFKIHNSITPVFDKYGFEVYNFSNLNEIDASNCEVIDGFHGSEKAYLRLLINMAKDSTILNDYVDLKMLEKKLEISTSCFSTVENPN